jgi:hypothetical protein
MAAVEADPEKLTVLRPGEQDPRLPPIPDDVVLISGRDRAEVLCRRIREHYGTIDAAMLTELIKRPVAKSSNLHDAVFSPETREMWFADAGRGTNACDEPYRRVSLPELVRRYRDERERRKVEMSPQGRGDAERTKTQIDGGWVQKRG